MRVTISSIGAVRAQGAVEVPAPASVVWGQMRDVEWFLTRDPLHARIRRTDGRGSDAPWSGASVLISHRLMGVGPDRVGRVLGWKEGVGFAISDLSRHGPRTGFPHVCGFRVVPVEEHRCRVVVDVRGRWTATWMPRWAVRAWLVWVLTATESRLKVDLGDFARWHARRASCPAQRPTPDALPSISHGR